MTIKALYPNVLVLELKVLSLGNPSVLGSLSEQRTKGKLTGRYRAQGRSFELLTLSKFVLINSVCEYGADQIFVLVPRTFFFSAQSNAVWQL